MSRLVAAPHPFRADRVDLVVPDGLTIAEMLEIAQGDPILLAHAHVWIHDQYIPRHLWHRVRPKPHALVTVRVVPHGGGGGGSKNPLRTLLTIAVVAAAAFVSGGALGGVFGAGTFGAKIAAGVVLVAGNMLVNAIAPIRPPTLPGLSGSGSSSRDSPTLFLEGARNDARPYQPVPVVLGIHKEIPPLGVQTYTEIVGDDQYLRMLVVWGYGPLKIENIKIGTTSIDDFEDVEIETREGRPGDDPITLIPDTVTQDDFSILLTQASDWHERTSDSNADELSVDVVFPQGLVYFTDSGGRGERTVAIQIQFRVAGGSPLASWSTPTFTATTVDAAWISGDTITFTHNRTSAVRHGFRWSVPTRGTYEVRIRRTTTDSNDTRIYDTVSWSVLRTITDEDPLNFPYPLAVTALSIRATNQLNRTVDELSATLSSYVDSYAGSEAVSNNPADLFRHVLQGNGNEARVADSLVDNEKLEDWYAFCTDHGFTFNMVRDYESSVWDTLADIAAAGRASPTVNAEGKWSVVYDYEQTIPVQHFTPRNSWGFEAEKNFPEQPDAFKIRFINQEKEYGNDERIVYADGFDANNAESFAGLDFPGVTDPDAIWKHGRFHIAQGKLRPEQWNLNADFEYIVANRGNLVLVTHDVLLVGLKSGRIKEVITGGSPAQITGAILDETLTMEADTDYGLSIRTVINKEVTKQIVTSVGDQTTVTFTTPFALGTIAAGDLFGFGILGDETIEGLVLSIEPQGDENARVSIIPNSPAIYSSDTGTIPPFDSKLTPLVAVPGLTISNVRSDESVLQLGSGNTLIPHIGVAVERTDTPLNVSLDVQIRSSATLEPFYAASVTQSTDGEILIGNVEQGARYDIRARWRDPSRLPGIWTYIYGHTVVGQSTAPDALQNATISVFGGSALIRWDRPGELDVRFGGEVRWRHSPETDVDLATWQSSTSIGQAAKGDDRICTLPLKPGTYLARVFDKSGRPSDVVKLSTKQASVLAYANVDTVTESPAFAGVNNGTVVEGNSLQLSGLGDFDSIPDLDAVGNLDAFGGIAASGTYTFAGGFDLTTVTRVRLTSTVVAISINVLDLIDERSDMIDLWEDFDGTQQSATDCRVQVRHTDDDPNSSPVAWSVWNDLDSAEFEARGFQFRALLTTNDPAFNIRVDTLSVVAEEIT